MILTPIVSYNEQETELGGSVLLTTGLVSLVSFDKQRGTNSIISHSLD